MVDQTMLPVLLLIVCLGVNGEDYSPLGRAIYLPNYDMLGKLEETGSQIVLPDKVHGCEVSTRSPYSSQTFTFYKDTKTFYSSMATSSSLSTKLQADFTLGLTLDVNTKSISGGKRTVTGNSLEIKAESYQVRLYKDCLQSQEFLDPNFFAEFSKLPPTINEPWSASAWAPYDMFLKKYGSHVVQSITYGSSINQMSFADTAESYSEHDFKIKSCMSLSGGFNASGIDSMGVDACSDIDQSEISQVNTFTMSNTLVVRGGSAETRNELISHRNAELINKFMSEATDVNATISYTFISVWEMLQVLTNSIGFQQGYTVASNLEYYYLGFLNYGCPYLEYKGQPLQAFNFSKYHTPNAPQYECSLAPEGCHNDDSCHYKPVWCSCRGIHCVSYYDDTLDTGGTKTRAKSNVESDWGWQGCNWKKGLAGSKCICRYPASARTVVWNIDGKTASYAMRRRASSQKSAEREEL